MKEVVLSVTIQLDPDAPAMTPEQAELYISHCQERFQDAINASKAAGAAGGHWCEHPVHSSESWRLEVESEFTRLGYWEWVVNRLEEFNDDTK